MLIENDRSSDVRSTRKHRTVRQAKGNQCFVGESPENVINYHEKPQIKGTRRKNLSSPASMCEITAINTVYAQSMGSLNYNSSIAKEATSDGPAEPKTLTATQEEESEENVASGKKKRGQSVKKSRSKLKKVLSWRQSNRSRRLIANARERSRIHIMSEAFEGLRRAVPSYSSDQKLSKLAILRLATSYISALSYLAENDTSTKSLKHFAECVDKCTQALQTEGRTRRKEAKKTVNEDIITD
ncbi:hypothetical protein pdam_00017789 [Pocillopora damicornis]|uniref:BHLH domain-containing protein n=1 Tax=Pocillopora damicornis TaxID=46731 RepID=A0A3M6UNS3_POCDA|nr:hypothetical protein pdam_00017789 [Pocillopora damicornis]